MWKEVLNVIPKLSNAEIGKLTNNLSKRFAKVAKGFGKGIASALKGGGLIGIAAGLLDKILNPLQAITEAMDKILAQSDDVVTNAKQFGSDAGKLFRLQQMGVATGIEPSDLYMLINKFQASIAEAQHDPNKPSAVRAFTGQKDVVQGFYEFIQSLQKMDKSAQIRIQQEVFGEKQILKMADFLSSDFEELSKQLGGPTSAQLNPRLQKMSDLKDQQDLLTARRGLNDAFNKGGIINASMVQSQHNRAKVELDRENKQLQSFENLQEISTKMDQAMGLLQDGFAEIGALVRKLTDQIDKFTKSRMGKGIISWFGGGDK